MDGVYRVLWTPCFHLARRSLGNDEDAKDATQNALCTLMREVARFDASRSGLGWALALVTWECRTIRRKQHRRRETAFEGPQSVAVDGGEDRGLSNQLGVDAPGLARLEHAEDVGRVMAALVQLTVDDQETLRALLDGAPAGAPVERKRRQRALDRLRAMVFGAVEGDEHV